LPDRENNLWFGRFGLGLTRLLDRAVVYHAAEGTGQDVRALAVQGGALWYAIPGAILHANVSDMRSLDTLGSYGDLPADQLSALAVDANGHIWAGTTGEGLFRQEATGRFVPVPLGDDLMSRQVHALVVHGDVTWAGTSNGVYRTGPDGLHHFTTENGLLHNEVNALYLDAEGRIWAACNNGGVSTIHDGEVRSFTLTQQGNAVHVTSITQDSEGTMWFGTN